MNKVTIKKYNGNDAYSWAIFVNGQVILDLTGLSRSQAAYYKNLLLARRF